MALEHIRYSLNPKRNDPMLLHFLSKSVQLKLRLDHQFSGTENVPDSVRLTPKIYHT